MKSGNKIYIYAQNIYKTINNHRISNFAKFTARVNYFKKIYYNSIQIIDTPVLMHENGVFIGFLENIHLDGGMMHIVGWTQRPSLEVCSEFEVKSSVYLFNRIDLAGVSGACGFDLTIRGNKYLKIFSEGTEVYSVSPSFEKKFKAFSTFATAIFHYLILCFLRLFKLNETWELYYNKTLRNMELNHRIPYYEIPIANNSLFHEALEADDSEHSEHELPVSSVDVIIPIYNAYDEVIECLDCVEKFTSVNVRIIIIDDNSTDIRINAALNEFSSRRENVKIIKNPKNLGFIGSVNLGLSLRRGHVILLNSDAFVTQGWLERLMAPILADRTIASVTPMTNTGEIASVPVICRSGPLRDGVRDAINACALNLDPLSTVADVPTGVGFCMAMSEHWLALEPALDMAFGRGYGEEVDWCQRVARRGARNILSGAVFVEHAGGASFGPEKQARIAVNNAIISRRYPGYDVAVGHFIQRDPMVGARLLLGFAQASAEASGRVPVYLAHTLGGGSELWLAEEIALCLSAGGSAVIIRPGKTADRTLLELHTPLGLTQAMIPALELPAYLAALPAKELVYSNLVDAKDPLTLLGTAINTLADADCLRIVLHDFFPLCPSYTLLRHDGQFCDLPAAEQCEKCYRRLVFRGIETPDTIGEWRAQWRRWLGRASVIEVFSQSSFDLLTRVYPEVANQTHIRPHEMPSLPAPVDLPAGKPFVIGVLGAIGFQKGAKVLNALAELADGLLEIVVIGEMDMAYHHPSITVHGRYERDQISDLSRHYNLSCWLFPSIWPETYSFAVRECLATGLAVVTFDLGAQAEAAAGAPNGIVVPLGSTDELVETLLDVRALIRTGNAEGLFLKGIAPPAADPEAVHPDAGQASSDKSHRPKVILHVGMNKAGSTAIQHCLFVNRERLLEQGVLVPSNGCHDAAHHQLASWLGFNHLMPPADPTGGTVGVADPHALSVARAELCDEIEASGATTVVISSENFVLNRPLGFVKEFFQGFDVEVIVVLRRHDKWWPSLWSQAILTVADPPWDGSFESFHAFQRDSADQHLSYRHLIETWEAAFPGAVRAIAYEEALMPRGVVPEFLAAAGLAGLVGPLDDVEIWENSSLPLNTLSIIDMFQRHQEIAPDVREAMIRSTVANLKDGPSAQNFLSGRLKWQLVLSQSADYAFLDDRFGKNGGTFFREPLPEDDGCDGPHYLPPSGF